MKKEIVELRKLMEEFGVDIYIVPTGDFHGSEYIHDYFKTREFLSGFTGSAGTLVVTRDEAKLWADSRYFLQAAAELEGSGIELMKMGIEGVPGLTDYLESVLSTLTKPVIGFDGRIVTCAEGRSFEEKAKAAGGSIVSTIDLADKIWPDRPLLSGNPLWELPLSSAGLPFDAKILQVRELMENQGATHHLITTLDDNAWLYNLRGSDVSRTPVFFSYTLITPDSVNLYIFDGVAQEGMIPEGVTVKNYFDIAEDIRSLPSGSVLLAIPSFASYNLVASVPKDIELIEDPYGPVKRLKACKNPIEIEATKEAHINDGVAMVNFIYWLKTNVCKLPMTEISIADYLENQRAAQPDFVDLSFETIAGYGPHGAIVHYSATPETNAEIKPEGFLLVDSGGQYINGTTDITRTIAVGPLTDRMKECYTGILKAHLTLAMAKFKAGTTGAELDKITRAPLEKLGLDYMHGTGHGLGHVLCVHDGPQNISAARGTEEFLPGMITSNEPGFYLEGEFGIRIENEILTVLDPRGESDFAFEMLTCCPYEREAIIKEMLSPEELDYMNSYHAWVYKALSPNLSRETAEWLNGVCAPL